MTWCRMLCQPAACVALLALVVLNAGDAVGQAITATQTSVPTYAIPLRDGSTATVWWDAISDPTHPGWRCKIPGDRGVGPSRTIIPLAAAAGDWRAALAEARALLTDRISDGE